jgi:hypothetical protein
VQPVQFPRKYDRYVKPAGGSAFVTAGAPSKTFPAKGWMKFAYPATDAATLMHADLPPSQLSGSLKARMESVS